MGTGLALPAQAALGRRAGECHATVCLGDAGKGAVTVGVLVGSMPTTALEFNSNYVGGFMARGRMINQTIDFDPGAHPYGS